MTLILDGDDGLMSYIYERHQSIVIKRIHSKC